MKILPIFIILLSHCAFSTELPWWKYTFKKQGNLNYYVGVSDGHSNLNDALNDAYNQAIKEAVRHCFGFNQKIVESFHSSLKRTDHTEDFLANYKEIKLVGITPTKEKIEKSDYGTYVVYRQISYRAKEIKKEQDRLSKNIKDKRMNEYNVGESTVAKGFLELNTSPTGAQFYLTGKSTAFKSNGSTNAKISAPIGQYDLLIKMDNYEIYEREVSIVNSSLKLDVDLIQKESIVILSGNTKGIKYSINGIAFNEGKHSLKAGVNYAIKATHPDFIDEVRNIHAKADVVQSIQFSLEPKDSMISILSTPSGASVYIDRNYIGETPINDYHIKEGTYLLELNHESSIPMSHSLKVEKNKNHGPLVFKLKPQINSYSSKEFEKDSKETRSWTLFYAPAHFEMNKLTLYKIPLGLERHWTKYLRFGFEYFKNIESDEWEVSKENQEAIRTSGKVNSELYSLTSKVTLLNFSKLSIHAGLDLNHQSKKYMSIDSLNKIDQRNSLGARVIAEFGDQAESSGSILWGTRFEYKKLAFKGSEFDRIALGLYFSTK